MFKGSNISFMNQISSTLEVCRLHKKSELQRGGKNKTEIAFYDYLKP